MKIRLLLIKIFLRLSISIGFFSAVADRLGWWSEKYAAWGNWDNFVHYTAKINPWFPEAMIPTLAYTATGLEIVLGVMLLIGFKTELAARLSGYLMLIFALSMTFSGGVKTALDASVFMGAAAAFALSTMKRIKLLELDTLFLKRI